jgi:C-terminal processing protease CtpA/Prc
MLVAVPASAQQRDTVMVRTVSAWQKDVDQLRQELLTQRKIELEFRKMLATLELRLKTAESDSNRNGLLAQSVLLSNRLGETNAQQFRIVRQLEALCAEVRKPEGWLGVYTDGIQLLDRQVDGRKVVIFLEPPVVASVDPGSPADRVGMRTGDVLIEIGGQRLLRGKVVFSELLRPGERVVVKLQRGGELVTLTPTVETSPDVTTTTPCAHVDVGTAYVVAPTPAQASFQYQGGNVQARGSGFGYVYTTRKDTTGAVAKTATVPAQGFPMASFFGGARSLAGLELMTLSSESSRAMGVTYGILVNQVAPGTPGREAGLQGGDILVLADSQELRSIGTLQRVLNRSQDRTVTLVVVRERKKETIQLRW